MNQNQRTICSIYCCVLSLINIIIFFVIRERIAVNRPKWVIIFKTTPNQRWNIFDFIPILVTRNVDFTFLSGYLNAFDGQSDTKVKLGGGAYDQPFSNKGFVLVRKSGAAESIKQKYARLNIIFNKQGFDNSSREKKLEFMDL